MIFFFFILYKNIVAAVALLCICADKNCDSNLAAAGEQMCLNFLLEKHPKDTKKV